MNVTIGTNGRCPARGFSLLELMIVVGITLVVSAVAIPGVLTATQNFKLRSTVSDASGLVQKARMLAVARNGFYPVLLTTTAPIYAFIDVDGSGNPSTTGEKTTILMPGNVVFDPTGSHPSDSTILNGLNAIYTLPKFNPRGLPCFGSPCQADPNKMYITFLRQDRLLGAPGWAAINVTPAGRVQVWTWDGSQWE